MLVEFLSAEQPDNVWIESNTVSAVTAGYMRMKFGPGPKFHRLPCTSIRAAGVEYWVVESVQEVLDRLRDAGQSEMMAFVGGGDDDD